MTEEEVYLGTKNYLIRNGFTILAGQPPRGVDHLPVIEIKENSELKGSKLSYKPDLIAYKNNYFIIIECKPQFDFGDYTKLKSVISSTTRLEKLYLELTQYHLLEKIKYDKPFSTFKNHIKISLSYSGNMINTKYNDINHICITNLNGTATSTI